MRHLFALLIASALPGEALAASLPLRTGTYVLRGTPCADPPFAAMREWDGVGLADPHSHACRARIVARRGAAYVIDNSCIGTGVGPGKRTGERLVVTPIAGGMRVGADTYLYCASGDLPASLRHRAVR